MSFRSFEERILVFDKNKKKTGMHIVKKLIGFIALLGSLITFAQTDLDPRRNIERTYRELWSVQDLDGLVFLNGYLKSTGQVSLAKSSGFFQKTRVVEKVYKKLQSFLKIERFRGIAESDIQNSLSGFYTQALINGCGVFDRGCENVNRFEKLNYQAFDLKIRDLERQDRSSTIQGTNKQEYYVEVATRFYREALYNAMKTAAQLERYLKPKENIKHFRVNTIVKLQSLFCSIPFQPNSDAPADKKYLQVCDSTAENVMKREDWREMLPLEIVTQELNEIISGLNTDILIYRQERSNEAYENYVLGFSATIAQLPGTLLMTQKLEDYGVGSLYSQDDLDPFFNYEYHKKTNVSQMEEAIKEAQENAVEGVMGIHGGYFEIHSKSPELIKEYIAEVVDIFPIPSAAVVLDHPEALFHFIESLHFNTIERERQKKRDRNIMWAGLIIGGLLLLSGIGSWAGMAILGKTAMIGTVYLSTVLSYSLTIGTIVGVADAIYSGQVAIKHYHQYQKLEQAIFTCNSGNAVAIEESMRELRHATIMAAVSLGTVVLDLKLLKVLGNANPKQVMEIADQIKRSLKSFRGARPDSVVQLTDARLAGRVDDVAELVASDYHHYVENFYDGIQNVPVRFADIGGVSPALQTIKKVTRDNLKDDYRIIVDLLDAAQDSRTIPRNFNALADELFAFPQIARENPMVEVLTIEFSGEGKKVLYELYSDYAMQSVDPTIALKSAHQLLIDEGVNSPSLIRIWHTHPDPVPLTNGDHLISQRIREIYDSAVEMNAIVDLGFDEAFIFTSRYQ